MKKLLLVAIFVALSSGAYAQSFYEQWGCKYTCKATYRETVTDALGFKRNYVVLPCKYNFCYLENGHMLEFYGMRDKMIDCKKDPYCFHFRFVAN